MRFSLANFKYCVDFVVQKISCTSLLNQLLEQARCPFHRKKYYCGTGILPIPSYSFQEKNIVVEQASCLFPAILAKGIINLIKLRNNNMKILHLTATLSTLLISSISASTLLADSTKTKAQNLPVDEPFCYMKTPDGKTVDLGKLCEKPPAPETSQTCVSGANMAAKVSIAQANYDGNFFSGKVFNQGCKTIKNVKVNYQVLDELGNLIDNGFIDAQPATLAPGESAAFRGAVVAGAKVQATHADAQE